MSYRQRFRRLLYFLVLAFILQDGSAQRQIPDCVVHSTTSFFSSLTNDSCAVLRIASRGVQLFQHEVIAFLKGTSERRSKCLLLLALQLGSVPAITASR